jgi:AcrR family transcriptional regulator
MSIGEAPEVREVRGRKRDTTIDARVLEVASRHLAARGYEGLSIAAIADEAGTTRQALYRRWPTKDRLIADAIRRGADHDCANVSDNPRRDLEGELRAFERAMRSPAAMSIVGTMLQESTPDGSRACFRENVVGPRTGRLRAILAHAQTLGQIETSADLDVAVAFATGAWYARAVAGDAVPAGWAKRTADMIWRAVGGG